MPRLQTFTTVVNAQLPHDGLRVKIEEPYVTTDNHGVTLRLTATSSVSQDEADKALLDFVAKLVRSTEEDLGELVPVVRDGEPENEDVLSTFTRISPRDIGVASYVRRSLRRMYHDNKVDEPDESGRFTVHHEHAQDVLARLCDEYLDPSGRLLEYVRTPLES